jgi:pyruvate dehydrogenase E1 component beta subunit
MTTTSTSINQIIVQQAVAEAIAEEMRRDPRVMMFGEGVATKRPELVAEFGAERVRNTPLAEAIIAGTAVGAAAMGCARSSTCCSRRS